MLIPNNAVTYELTLTLPAVAANKPICALIPAWVADNEPDPDDSVALLRIEVLLTTAVATKIKLVQVGSNASPGTVFSRESGQAVNGPFSLTKPHADSNSRVAYAWSVDPAANPIALRNTQLNGVIGNNFTWEWPEDNPCCLNTASDYRRGIALWNADGANPTAAMIVNVRWRDFGIPTAY